MAVAGNGGITMPNELDEAFTADGPIREIIDHVHYVTMALAAEADRREYSTKERMEWVAPQIRMAITLSMMDCLNEYKFAEDVLLIEDDHIFKKDSIERLKKCISFIKETYHE